MDDKAWKAVAQDIHARKGKFTATKDALLNEIASLREGKNEGLIDDDTTKAECREKYRKELHKIAYKKSILAKLKELEGMNNQLMNESGDFDATQLTLFDVNTVEKEFEKQQEESAENTEEDSEESNDDDDFEFVTDKKESEEPE